MQIAFFKSLTSIVRRSHVVRLAMILACLGGFSVLRFAFAAPVTTQTSGPENAASEGGEASSDASDLIETERRAIRDEVAKMARQKYAPKVTGAPNGGGAGQDPLQQNASTSHVASSSEAQEQTFAHIRANTLGLYNESQPRAPSTNGFSGASAPPGVAGTAPTYSTFTGRAIEVVPLMPNDTPRSVIQAEDEATIKGNAFRLYHETLRPKLDPGPVIGAPVRSTASSVVSTNPPSQAVTPMAVVAPPSVATSKTAVSTTAASPSAVSTTVAPAKAPAIVPIISAASPPPAQNPSLAPETLKTEQQTVGPARTSVDRTVQDKDLPDAKNAELQSTPPLRYTGPVKRVVGTGQDAQVPASSGVSSPQEQAKIAGFVSAGATVPIVSNLGASSATAAGQASPSLALEKPPEPSSTLGPVPTAPSPRVSAGQTLEAPQSAKNSATTQVKNEDGVTSSKITEDSKPHPEKTDTESKDKDVLSDEGEGEADSAYLRRLVGNDNTLPLMMSAEAGGPTLAEPVSLPESVAFALRNNFEILASVQKTRGAYWDKVGAYSELAPSMQFNYSQGAEKSDPASFNDTFGNRVLDSTHFRRDRDLTIRQPIIDLSVIADILAAGDREEIAQSDQRDAREGIASDTVNVYLKLLQNRITIHLTEQYKSYLSSLSERMKARVEGGGGTGADLERIKSRLATAENARIEAIGDYETNLSEYQRITKVTPSQIRMPAVLSPPIPRDPQAALDMAMRTNPSYRSSLIKIDAATDDRNKAFTGLLPKLSVQYGKDFTYDAGGAAAGNPVDGVYPDQTTSTVMLVAQWSLNGGTAVAGTVSGIAKERELDYRSQDVRARLEQGIRASYTAIRAAKERRSALRKSVEANEKVVKGFDEQFKFGSRSLFDLLDAYEQLYNSRLNLMRIVVANAEASYQVHRQIGELIPSVIGEEEKE